MSRVSFFLQTIKTMLFSNDRCCFLSGIAYWAQTETFICQWQKNKSSRFVLCVSSMNEKQLLWSHLTGDVLHLLLTSHTSLMGPPIHTPRSWPRLHGTQRTPSRTDPDAHFQSFLPLLCWHLGPAQTLWDLVVFMWPHQLAVDGGRASRDQGATVAAFFPPKDPSNLIQKQSVWFRPECIKTRSYIVGTFSSLWENVKGLWLLMFDRIPG